MMKLISNFAIAIAIVLTPEAFAQHQPLSEAERSKTLEFLSEGDLRTHRLSEREGQFEVLVEPGTEPEAESYYRLIDDEYLLLPGDILQSDLNDLLSYCGYPLSATTFEAASSTDLMDLSTREDEVLATRFFAPKIVDVSGKTFPIEYGWRKLVRLLVRADSNAARAGMQSLFILFNYFDKKPLFPSGDAGAIQAILVRDEANTDGFPVYFFVYGGQPDYSIGLFLKASFDGATKDPDEKYYVPRACAQCHGADEGAGARKVKVNYLDTDHWFDRIGIRDDFGLVDEGAVLPDGGRPAPRRFRRAFGVFKKLNSEILAQNRLVDPTGFQVKAIQKWLDLHKRRETHRQPVKRGLPGTRVWGNDDRLLLESLNRYCFRCHSSFEYHVFDRDAVGELASPDTRLMQQLIEFGVMPQDRILDPAAKTLLIDLLDRLGGR